MGRLYVIVAFWLACVAGLILPNCATSRQQDDVIVVVIDTWRWDYLDLMRELGHPGPAFLNDLATNSVNFSRCRSHSSNTNLAMSVLWSGALPDETGVLTQLNPLPQRFDTLAEAFQKKGYETVGFCANPVLKPKKGFSQGFDRYVLTELTGDKLLSELSAFADSRPKSQKPLFLYVHFMDCHFPYFGTEYIDEFGAEPLELFDRVYRDEADVEGVLFGHSLSERDKILGRARYLSSILQVDEYLKKMAEKLSDVWQNARIVVTADHGESLGEHDYYFGHSLLTYEVSLRVPLLLRVPGKPARLESSWVDHMDLHSELLRWADGEIGQLVHAANAEKLPSKIHLAWGHPNLGQYEGNVLVPQLGRNGARRSAALGNEKLIIIPQPDGPIILEYYDLDADPYETQDVGSETFFQSENADRLLAAIQDVSQVESIDIPMDDAERERLRSLGYLGN